MTRADPSSAVPATCLACGRGPLALLGTIQGFVAGETFPILQCEDCLTQTVQPLEVPDGLYEAIYLAGEEFPGYARYHRYAKVVSKLRNPLKFLHYAEAPYWSVIEALKDHGAPRSVRVLEVGSGLGYLTAALRKAGYEAWGFDLSEEAVMKAQERFGPWYQAGSSIDDALDRLGIGDTQFSMIVALELIEHVTDPVGLISEMAAHMAEGGEIVVSTPNRSGYAPEALWCTTKPPVHLHWFSEDGLKALGEQVGLTSRLTDFTDLNRLHRIPKRDGPFPQQTKHGPRLSEDLKPLKISPIQGVRLKDHIHDLPGSEHILSLLAHLRLAGKRFGGQPATFGPKNRTLSIRYQHA